MNIRTKLSFSFLLVIAILATGPAGAAKSKFQLRRPLRVDPDNRPIPQPESREVSDMYAILHNSWLRHLSPEKAFAKKLPAMNVNAWDEVPDSSWFTNRIGVRPISYAEILGGLEGRPPASAPWRVIRRNDSGYTPKVDIEDSVGERYVLKFDPKGARERNSAAERIGTLIMYTAGYNVPHNSIVYFRLQDLKFDENSRYRDPLGRTRQLRAEDVESVLKTLDPMPDGRWRGIASMFLKNVLGPFVFTGTRKDDPNDTIPHELRRELRGMRVIGAWINHVDIKDRQAMDVYHTSSDGAKYVRHYMLDLSATLGAYEWPIAPFRVGHEYMFDGSAIGRSFVSLGAWRRPWEVDGKVEHAEVGYFSDERFEPEKWKPSFPNLAFEQMDDGDGYWGAKIVTAFNDELIQSLAEAGEYSRPEVTKYVDRVLRERRNAIGRYWFNRVTPLEDITLLSSSIRFRDLAVDRRYMEASSREYRFHVEDLDGRRLTQDRTGRTVDIPQLEQLATKVTAPSADGYGRIPLIRVLIQSKKGEKGWALPVDVVIGRTQSQRDLTVLGWTHAAP